MAAAATSSRELPSYESDSDESSTEDVIRKGDRCELGHGTVQSSFRPRVELGFNWSVILPTELSEIPLGELQKLREKVGSKK